MTLMLINASMAVAIGEVIQIGAFGSVAKENWKLGALKDATRETAEYEFACSAVAIATHDEKTAMQLLRRFQKDFAGVSFASPYMTGLRFQAMPAQMLGQTLGRFDIPLCGFIAFADAEDVNLLGVC